MEPVGIIITIVVYFIVLLGISAITSRNADNNSFFIGNRQSPWYIVAFGMIGASLSGVTFISVPGWVGSTNFYYMQMVLGYFLGYLVIAHVLMPVYYKLQLTSIYSYLDGRFGPRSYKTGASFFLLSRTLGAAARLYLVAFVLQTAVFDTFNVPFYLTVFVTIALIWIYTYKGGIKTIIWTDTLQTFFMIASVLITIYIVCSKLDVSFGESFDMIFSNSYKGMPLYGDIFNFDGWYHKQFFPKQILNGALITIVMTGLDQDMMQKNLSCRNLKDAKKNMFWFSVVLVAVNFIFLALGGLLLIYTHVKGVEIGGSGDKLFPYIATSGELPAFASLIFIIGLIAAAYSSADSALTSLTTSFTVDILGKKDPNHPSVKKTRIMSHALFSILLLLTVLGIKQFSEYNIIHILFTVASYTYGPLLGMYALGLFTKRAVNDRLAPFIALASPVLAYLLNISLGNYFGYEILLINGGITFILLYASGKPNKV